MVCSRFSSAPSIAVAQFLRKNRGGFFFPALLPQIDDPDQRHLAFVDALGERDAGDTCRASAL